jgi:hypothetical protein
MSANVENGARSKEENRGRWPTNVETCPGSWEQDCWGRQYSGDPEQSQEVLKTRIMASEKISGSTQTESRRIDNGLLVRRCLKFALSTMRLGYWSTR